MGGAGPSIAWGEVTLTHTFQQRLAAYWAINFSILIITLLKGYDYLEKNQVNILNIGKYFVKTPTTTSIQLNSTSTEVGFDVIMTVHTPPPPPHPDRNSTAKSGKSASQTKPTKS